MSTFNSGSETYDDEDIKLLEDRHKRKSANVLKRHRANPLPENQTHATPSGNLLFREILPRFHSETLPKNNPNEETNPTSKLALEDTVMTDTATKLTEEDSLILPSLRQLLPQYNYTPEPQENIARPYYTDYLHNEGFVAWWDNKTGKGMIVDYRYNLEYKVELKDIKPSNYGALVPGTMVEFEHFDEGINKGFHKFWVVSGCVHVL